ncbi:MAG: TrbI/VirB10 family protein [Gammaproteobacteria bacterium]
MNMTAGSQWFRMRTPEQRRLIVVSGVFTLVMGLIYLSVGTETTDFGLRSRPLKLSSENVLTGEDPKALGLDALGARQKAAEKERDQLRYELENITRTLEQEREQRKSAEESLHTMLKDMFGETATRISNVTSENRKLLDQRLKANALQQNETNMPSVPVEALSAQVAVPSAPVAAQSTPVAAQSTPVAVQSTPVAVQSTPVAVQSTPVAVQSAPVEAPPMTAEEELYALFSTQGAAPRQPRANEQRRSTPDESVKRPADPVATPIAFNRQQQSPSFNRQTQPVSSKRPVASPKQDVKIKVYGGEAEPEEVVEQEEGIFLPAGSTLPGVLITGADAPTSLSARRDPTPVLVRIKHEAILPNRFHADVRDCFVVLAAMGDLSSERANMRSETLTCVREDGGVIEVALDAFAAGEDGKAGMRGRLVTREGAIIARTLLAGFLAGIGNIYRPTAISGLQTSPGGDTLFQKPDTGDALEAAGFSGASRAMERLADYYIELAEEKVPVIEVDAGRQVDVILTKGVTLELREAEAS